MHQLASVIKRSVLMMESSNIEPDDLPAGINALSAQAGNIPFDLTSGGVDFEEVENGLTIKVVERAKWISGKSTPLYVMSNKALQAGWRNL